MPVLGSALHELSKLCGHFLGVSDSNSWATLFPFADHLHFEDLSFDSISRSSKSDLRMVKSFTDTESSSKSLKTMRLTERHVSFRNDVSARRALHLNDYTDDEYHNAWFFQEDLQRFKEDVLRTVKLIAIGHHVSDDNAGDFCARGVEYRTREGNKNRLLNKLAALEAVLGLQDAQWDHGIHNAEAIAIAYRKVSAHCGQQARLRALNDQQEALACNFGVSLNVSPISKCKRTLSSTADTGLQSVRQTLFNAAA